MVADSTYCSDFDNCVSCGSCRPP